MSIQCPLCGNKMPIPFKKIPIEPIRDYWSSIGVDISHLIDSSSRDFEILRCVECDLKFYSPSIIGDARFYDSISKHHWYYNSNKWEFDVVLRHLQNSGKAKNLLEVGSGAGFFLEKAARFFEQVEGVELNPNAVKMARAKGLAVSDTDFFKLSKTYDAVVSFQVIEHVEQPGTMLKGMVERLNPGGKLVVVVPNQDGFLGRLRHNYLNMPPHHLTLWSKKPFEYVSDHFGVRMISYETEPFSIEMYIALRDDHLRSIQTASGVINRISNKISRVIMNSTIVSDYLAVEDKFLGHSHVAIFEKL